MVLSLGLGTWSVCAPSQTGLAVPLPPLALALHTQEEDLGAWVCPSCSAVLPEGGESIADPGCIHVGACCLRRRPRLLHLNLADI